MKHFPSPTSERLSWCTGSGGKVTMCLDCWRALVLAACQQQHPVHEGPFTGSLVSDLSLTCSPPSLEPGQRHSTKNILSLRNIFFFTEPQKRYGKWKWDTHIHRHNMHNWQLKRKGGWFYGLNNTTMYHFFPVIMSQNCLCFQPSVNFSSIRSSMEAVIRYLAQIWFCAEYSQDSNLIISWNDFRLCLMNYLHDITNLKLQS